MTNEEIREIREPLQNRLLKASGRLSELEKERGASKLTIDSCLEISDLQKELNDTPKEGEDFELVVWQLDKRLNIILTKLQEEFPLLYF